MRKNKEEENKIRDFLFLMIIIITIQKKRKYLFRVCAREKKKEQVNYKDE